MKRGLFLSILKLNLLLRMTHSFSFRSFNIFKSVSVYKKVKCNIVISVCTQPHLI